MLNTVSILAVISGIIATATAQVAPNMQSCKATDHGAFASYGVNIGVSWADGSGCDDVYNQLQTNTSGGITNWQCEADSNGNTQLYFNAPVNMSGNINSALEHEYPTIQGGFNCPDN